MHPDEREDVAEFAFEVVSAMRAQGGRDGRGLRARPGLHAGVRKSASIRDFIKGLMEARDGSHDSRAAAGRHARLRDLMMPALVRVGAVTAQPRALRRREHPRRGRTFACSSRWRSGKTAAGSEDAPPQAN